MASNLQRIADAVAEAPDFDARKIEHIRRALSRGTLQIDPERIADKLIRLDTDLHRRHVSVKAG